MKYYKELFWAFLFIFVVVISNSYADYSIYVDTDGFDFSSGLTDSWLSDADIVYSSGIFTAGIVELEVSTDIIDIGIVDINSIVTFDNTGGGVGHIEPLEDHCYTFLSKEGKEVAIKVEHIAVDKSSITFTYRYDYQNAISGSLDYLGSHPGDILVGAWDDPVMDGPPVESSTMAGGSYPVDYNITGLTTGSTYYIGALINDDVQDLQSFVVLSTDPWAVYDSTDAESNVFAVIAGSAGVNMDLVDGTTEYPSPFAGNEGVLGEPQCVTSHNKIGSDDYYSAFFMMRDSTEVVSVSVSAGPGISAPEFLVYNDTDTYREFTSSYPIVSWMSPPYGNPPISTPSTYTFTISGSTENGPASRDCYLTGFIMDIVSNPSPAEGEYIVSPLGTISWTGIGGADSYRLELTDRGVGNNMGTPIWQKEDIQTTSCVYAGPALSTGHHYEYMISAKDTDGNSSSLNVEFKYKVYPDITSLAPVNVMRGEMSKHIDIYGQYFSSSAFITIPSMYVELVSSNWIDSGHMEMYVNVLSTSPTGSKGVQVTNPGGADDWYMLNVQESGSGGSGAATKISAFSEPWNPEVNSTATLKAFIKDDMNYTVSDATNPVTFIRTYGSGNFVGYLPAVSSVTLNAAGGLATIDYLAPSTTGYVDIDVTSPGLYTDYIDLEVMAGGAGANYGTISGDISYTGSYVGSTAAIKIEIFDDITFSSASVSSIQKQQTGPYQINNAPANMNLYIRAYKDINFNGMFDVATDPNGLYHVANSTDPQSVWLNSYGHMSYVDIYMSDAGTEQSDMYISYVSPYQITQGAGTVYVDIHGDFKTDVSSDTSFSFDPSIQVSSKTVINSTKIKLGLNITATLLTGYYDLILEDERGSYADKILFDAIQIVGSTNAGEASVISCYAQQTSLPADGVSMTEVKAEIQDNNYNRVSNATNTVTFSIIGQGTLVGTNPVNAVNGIATINVKAGTVEGVNLEVKAESPGISEDYSYISIYSTSTGSSFGSVSGNVDYYGEYASASGDIYVLLSSTSTLDSSINVTLDTVTVRAYAKASGDKSYNINSIPAGEALYLMCFKDLNSNNKYDSTGSTEPYAFLPYPNNMSEAEQLWFSAGDMRYFDMFMNDPGAGTFTAFIDQVQPYSFTLPTADTTFYFNIYGDGFENGDIIELKSPSGSLDVTASGYLSTTSMNGSMLLTSSDYPGSYDIVLKDSSENIKAMEPGKVYISDETGSGSGVATQISCWADSYSIPADSVTTTVIYAEIVDSNYNKVTNATDRITFSISGFADIVSANPVYATYGEARLTIKSKGTPDNVWVTASAQDLISGTVEINTYDTGSGSAYGSIEGNVFYSGLRSGSKYIKAITAGSPSDTWYDLVDITETVKLDEIADGVNNELALEALRRKIENDMSGITVAVANQLITDFPYGGWQGSAAADSFGHYRINNAVPEMDLIAFAFVDTNNDGDFTENIAVSTNTESYNFYKYYGTGGDYPGILWMYSGGFIDYIDIDISDPNSIASSLDIQVYGINPPSVAQGLPGQSPVGHNVSVFGNGFVDGSILSFYPDNPPVTVVASIVSQYSIEATIEISSNVYAGDYDVVVTTDNYSAKAYNVFHIDSSMGSNSISGEVTYNGVDGSTGTIYMGVFKGCSADGEPFRHANSVSSSTDTLSYNLTGLPDGMYSIYGYMDINGNSNPDPTEPKGMCQDNPVYLYGGVSESVGDVLLFKETYNSVYISGAYPPSVVAGATNTVVSIFGGNLDGTVDISFGPGITVSTYSANEHDISATIDVSTAAYAGDRTVMATDGTGYVASAMGIFRVTSSGSEGSGEIEGTISYINSAGTGSGEKDGEIVTAIWQGGVFQGPPIKEAYKTYVATAPSPANYSISGLAGDNYSVFTFVDINGDREPDMSEPQTVYQFNPVTVTDGLTTRVDMTIYDLYTSTSVDQIIVDYISPMYVMAGTSTLVNLYASGLQSDSQIQFGQGVTVSTATLIYSSATVIGMQVDISMSATANEGFRDVTIINSDGSRGFGMNKLVITPAATDQDMSTGDGSISGTLYNNSNSTGTYMIALWDGYIFNGPPIRFMEMTAASGVTVTTYSITGLADSSNYYIGVYIDTNYEGYNGMPDHIPGVVEEPENVYGGFDSPQAIFISGGSAVKNINLTFDDPSTIEVKEIMPDTLVANSENFDIFVFGYGFDSGINISSITISPAGIALNSVRFIDFSQVVLNVNIGATGTRYISITNGTDTSTGTVTVVANQAAFTSQTGEAPFEVTVKDSAGNPIDKALATAVSFDQYSYEPDANISRSGYTKSDGKCTLFLKQNMEYTVAAGKHMYTPSIKVQMMDPWNTPVTSATGSKIITLTARPNPNYATTPEYEKVGVIEGKIDNVRLSDTPRILLMSVDNKTTGEPVNFAMIPAAAKTLYYSIGNIPITDKTDEYEVGVFDPFYGIGTSSDVAAAVLVSEDGVTNAVEINLDFEDVETLSATGDEEVTTTAGIAFEGHIYEDTNLNGSYDDGEGIENARVMFWSYAYDENQPNTGIEPWLEVVTNASGKYAVYDIPYYETNQIEPDYLPNYVGPEGGYPNNNTYKVSVFAPGYKGINDYYGSATGKYSDYERTYQESKKTLNYPLTQATGNISGYIYLGSTSTLISADVNVWPDHTSYGTMVSNPGLSHGYERSEDGSFNITGLSDGNYMLNVWSEFNQYGYEYNNGQNQEQEYGGGDDLRVTVKDGAYAVYQASSGVKVSDATNPIRIVLKKEEPVGMTVDCNINGTVTLVRGGMDLTGTMVVARENWNAITEEDMWGNTRPPRVSYVDLSTMTGSIIDYTVIVPTGSYYVKLISPKNGVLGESEYDIVFESTGSLRNNVDFDIAPSGKIKGVVKYPDGKLFVPNREIKQWMQVKMHGTSVECWACAEVNDKGEYIVNGLLPGTYELTAHLPEGLSYIEPRIENIIVSEGEVTTQNITFETGQELKFEVPGVSTAILSNITEAGSGNLVSNLSVLPVKSGEKFVIAEEIMESDGPPGTFYADWGTINSTGTAWSWHSVMLEPGIYDLYLMSFGLVNGSGENPGTYWCNETPFGTILQKKTGITLSTETVSFIYSKGSYSIGGNVSGQYIFTDDDIKKASTNFDYFLDLIPKVTVLDSSGIQKAGGAVVPVLSYTGGKFSGTKQIEEWVKTGDSASILSFFSNPANSQYRIKGLAPGSYTVIANSKNYPPVIKKVTIVSSNATQDIDFDAALADAGTVSGTIKVKNSTQTIAGATVVLYVGTEQRKMNSRSDGTYSFIGLNAGSYKIKVTASGYGFAEDKVTITKGQITTRNFEFSEVVRSKLTGTVYKQKMPYPKTYSDAIVVLLDQTEQEASEKKIATKLETTTGDSGSFSFSDLASGHIFKLYIVAEGYRLAEYTINKATYTETQDVVLQSDPPRISIYQWKDEDNNLQFQIESNKTLVTKPTVKFVQGLNTIDVSAFVVEGLSKIYSMTIYKNPDVAEMDIADFPVSGFNVEEDIGIRVTGTDGSQEGLGLDSFNLTKSKTKIRLIISDLIAIGGDVSIDKSGTDKTKITINPGALTITGSTVTPTISMDKTETTDDDAIDDEEKDLTASEIYTLNIINAILSGDSPLTFTFDYDETKDTETITVCYYDPTSDKWLPINAVITRDPVTGTLEIDFTAADITTESGASILAYAPYIKGSGYDASRAVRPIIANTILSGMKFGVFTDAPTYISDEQGQAEANATYSGNEFRVYNFPNPFDLDVKQVTLANTGTNSALQGAKTVSGTVLKYYLPAKYDAGSKVEIKFYIYNIAGEMVRVIDSEPLRDGGYIYFTEWDGKTSDNEKCASGIYLLFARINGEFVMDEALKMAIVK